MGFLGGHLPEIIIVLVVILIIWGPGKLPDIGAGIGKGIREFRKASSEDHDSTPLTAQSVPVIPSAADPVPAQPMTAPADATTRQS